MARRKTPSKRIVLPDSLYNSSLVTMLINRILRKGKKTLAQRIVYKALNEVSLATESNPLDVLHEAITFCTPGVEVKSKRIGGSVYQVPIEVNSSRGTSLSIRWLVLAAQSRSERGMILRLANEIIDASHHTGQAIRKKEEIYRMAEANKAFAHHRF